MFDVDKYKDLLTIPYFANILEKFLNSDLTEEDLMDKIAELCIMNQALTSYIKRNCKKE